MNDLLHGIAGYLLLLAFAWAIGEKRRDIPWRTVFSGIALQVALALLFLKLPAFKSAFLLANEGLLALQDASRAGTSFVFGYLGGAPLPFAEAAPGGGFILAFQALPLVLLISALSSLLFYWRVLPLVVRTVSVLLEKTLGLGGAVGMSTAANVFVGMVEAPLLIRPYLATMSRGELFIVMTAGMAGVAGTVMALYASILGSAVPDAFGHILVASFISAPAAVVFSVLIVPPQGPPTGQAVALPQFADSAMDAITKGTVEGVNLLIQIVAMLIVLVALVHLANQVLGLLPWVQNSPLSLQRLLGWLMAPFVWMAGVPWAEAPMAGALMGTKTVLNELIAYLDMAKLSDAELAPRTRIIMTYALCGFANLGSLGILIGGMCAMAPARRDEILRLGPRTLISGTLATLACGSVVGMMI
jgi:CNT family concentrative nucleoside transporter